MAELQNILYGANIKAVIGRTSVSVNAVHFDSRQVEKGSVFVAVKGTKVNGHQYIPQVVEAGAVAVVGEYPVESLFIPETVTYVQVASSARTLGIMASNFYGNPSSRLKLIAVTGTNGKTSTVTLLYNLYQEMGYKTGLLSTVENRIGEKVVPATHTTGDAVQINRLLKEMVDANCTHCFMEASSHAIVQERTAGLKLLGGVFTNISRDHLDYHGTFNNYIKAKKKLFDELPKEGFALVNTDDKRGKIMVQNTRAAVYSFGLKNAANFKARVLNNTIEGLELDITDYTGNNHKVWFKLVGEFNAYNLLGIFSVAVLLEDEAETVLEQLSMMPPAPGRFEQVIGPNQVAGIVDYAHTPDALKNVLDTINKVRNHSEQLITIIGCGGNRDKGKRPMMAKIAAEQSDKVVITSDNPRDEDPEQIIDDMMEGVPAQHYKKILRNSNRKEAIRTACNLANVGDIILLAGKGHETYQEIKGVKHDFDDRAILQAILNEEIT